MTAARAWDLPPAALFVRTRKGQGPQARWTAFVLLARMQDYLSNYIAETRMENGGLRAHSRAEFVADMRELAKREGLGKIDPETGEISPEIDENDLTDIRALRRLELIFDTQTEAAQEYGYWKQGQDPDVLEVFPAQRFIRVRPVETPRAIHAANEGVVRRKDDLEFWVRMNEDFGVPWGPWGFNSGMGVEDVDRDEAVALGVMREADEVRPVEREFNEGLQAGVREMGGGMLAALERATGGTAAGGVLRARERVADSAPKIPRLPGRMEAVDVPERTSPASAKITGLGNHPDADALRATLSVIDSLHDDGLLGDVALITGQGRKVVGEYEWSDRDGRPLRINVSAASPWPELTFLHEIGHWIDQGVFGGRGGFGSATGRWPEMARLMARGETARELKRMIRTERTVPGGRRNIYPGAMALLKLNARPEEIFARGYAEWVCRESAHPRLSRLLDHADSMTLGGYGLRGEDRNRFRNLIDRAFQEKGWK